MDVSLHRPTTGSSGRGALAAIAAASIAAVELLLLVVVGGALIAKPSKPGTHHPAKAKAAATTKATSHKTSPVRIHRTAPAAKLARRKVTVLVLNGNGRQGAAASRRRAGSPTAATASAASRTRRSSDFTRSLVMYRRGFEGEGRRLARDLGIGLVGPLDGIQTSQLHGANAVLVIGA